MPESPPEPRASLSLLPAPTSNVPDYKQLWYECATGICADTYGYGRSPAYWFTLNCPYNYLHEIHRFQDDEKCLEPLDRVSKDMRFRWSLDNPDLVCQLHAMRVELITRMVIPTVVQPTPKFPFQYWTRFENGYSGNPHAHAIGYAPFNPSFDNVVKDIDTLQRLQAANTPGADDLRLWEDVTEEVTKHFSSFVSEKHPAKDSAGEPLYDFVLENINHPRFGKPQCVNLRQLLQELSQEI